MNSALSDLKSFVSTLGTPAPLSREARRPSRPASAALNLLDHGGGAGHQHAAQGLVAGPRDDAEPDFAAGGMVFRRQADPGREQPPRFEQLGRRGFHFQQRRADRADAGDLGEPLAAFIGLVPGFELCLDVVDLGLQLCVLLSLGGEQLPSQGGHALVDLNALEQVSQVSNAAFFEYSRSRHGEYPSEHLRGWAGVMQADAFAGFNELYDGARKPGPIVEASFWANSAGKFFDLAKLTKAPIALEAVRRIDELFDIEREINGKPPDERKAVRQEKSKPLVEALEVWLREQRARVSAKSDIGKAINYSLNRWASFVRFLDDGRICLSNNAAERGCVAWPWAGAIGPSPARTQARAGPHTFLRSSEPATNDVDPQACSPMCWRNCPIIRPNKSPNSCRGTGKPARNPQSKPPPPERSCPRYPVANTG